MQLRINTMTLKVDWMSYNELQQLKMMQEQPTVASDSCSVCKYSLYIIFTVNIDKLPVHSRSLFALIDTLRCISSV